MSDLVKRLRTSWDTDRSIISQTGVWMLDRQDAATRIEALEAQRDELLEALADIAENETMTANATVRRMANAARNAINNAKETQ